LFWLGPRRVRTRHETTKPPLRRLRGGGLIVAASYDYFDNLKTTGRVLTLIAAVLMWPMLVFGFDVRIQR
jgi:hypothetical protein